jgi:hypothetical protein
VFDPSVLFAKSIAPVAGSKSSPVVEVNAPPRVPVIFAIGLLSPAQYDALE